MKISSRLRRTQKIGNESLLLESRDDRMVRQSACFFASSPPSLPPSPDTSKHANVLTHETYFKETMVAFTPALAYVAGSGGNFVSCIALPRKTVQSIYVKVRVVL